MITNKLCQVITKLLLIVWLDEYWYVIYLVAVILLDLSVFILKPSQVVLINIINKKKWLLWLRLMLSFSWYYHSVHIRLALLQPATRFFYISDTKSDSHPLLMWMCSVHLELKVIDKTLVYTAFFLAVYITEIQWKSLIWITDSVINPLMWSNFSKLKSTKWFFHTQWAF